ncbi:MAG: hypothetical protein KJ583_04675 [Nanoarchaeota archaeon]|nr:hypothetical protein [Nanoarchaeota archaeon]MBU1270222.1 hypothetical protein [Nanoarchaeota archaeon]MBU1604586.1 hypothetical protein [Nanoarchaeota archaeon]MBU2443532.1 hypothetical protein [Nanoarchaeota archaeon]
MTFVELLKNYKTYHLPEPIDYPSWIFDFEHDLPEKHSDMSKWGEIKSRLFGGKNGESLETLANDTHSMWVEYGFSPLIYSQFGGEIITRIKGSNLSFANFLKNGYFDSDPDFKVHIFRAVRLYRDDPEILFGRDGRVHYFVMSDREYASFSPDAVKSELNLDDITKLEYEPSS